MMTANVAEKGHTSVLGEKPVLSIKGLRKKYGRKTLALDGLCLEVGAGSLCGILGRNGAGKTTLLRILAGVLRADSGQKEIFGRDAGRLKYEQRKNIFYVPQDDIVDKDMSVNQLVSYIRPFYPEWSVDRANRMLELFCLDLDRPMGQMSGGQRRAAILLCAISSGARLLLLDEPMNGLDPLARRNFSRALMDLMAREPKPVILLSTHIIADLERLADRIVFVDQGKVIYDNSLEQIQGTNRHIQIFFCDSDVPADFTIKGARHERVQGAVYSAALEGDYGVELSEIEKKYNVNIREFPLTLEDMFIDLCGGDNGNNSREGYGNE